VGEERKGGGEVLPRDVALLCVGRELLKGNTLDRNANWMARRIEPLGLRCWRFSTVDDVAEEIGREIRWILESGTRFLVTTGGLGPTFDDMTLRSIASALDLPMEVDPRAEAWVREAYARLYEEGLTSTPELTPARRKMAFMPKGARPLSNPLGAAPGMALEWGGTMILSFPGVPEEMQAMFPLHAEPLFREAGGGAGNLVRREVEIAWPGKDESLIERHVQEITSRYPGLYVKSRVRGTGRDVTIRITLWCEGEDPARVEEILAKGAEDLKRRLDSLEPPSPGEAGRPAPGEDFRS